MSVKMLSDPNSVNAHYLFTNRHKTHVKTITGNNKAYCYFQSKIIILGTDNKFLPANELRFNSKFFL